MNPVAEEIMSYYGISSDDSLAHVGKGHLDGGHSGRYPWGSGKDSYQRSMDFLDRIDALKKDGWTETPENIMSEFELTTTQYRAQKSLANSERRSRRVSRAKELTEQGKSPTEVAKIMSEEMGRSVNESTVRSWLDEGAAARMMAAKNTADFLRQQINEKGAIQVGAGVELELNVTREKLNQALAILESEGYPVMGGGVPQVTNKGQQTNIKVIFPQDTPYRIDDKGRKVSSAVYDLDNIHTIKDYISHDNGDTFETFHYPKSIDSSRVKILLADEVGPEGTTGSQKDGLIQIRRGVPDLSLGESKYCQVRILVDDTKYLKGMAVYSDNIPDGYDILFNSSKSTVEKSYKEIKKDPENPFGSAIKEKGGQYWYTDADGNKQLGAINKRADEGDWTEWKDKLPAQFLSKQSLSMAQKQLGIAIADKVDEYDDICSLNNPTVKKHLLNKFADECDSAAVHLQAAALPGQKYHVIIPINTMKDNEIYAPGYDEGTKLALIRYPHGGTFEIPILTVNNKNKDAKSVIGTDAIDAVGINKNVADKLSGADFDGDTVMCIPTHDSKGRVKVASRDLLPGLVGFDDKASYGYDNAVKDSDGKTHYYRNGKEFRVMNNTQTEMGIITNLITDMTLQGADDDKMARAVRHSMVVVDAEKHKLDYKQSEYDNDIAALKREYQVSVDKDGKVKYGGSATLLSRSKGEATVDKRQGNPIVNMEYKKNGDPNPDYDPSRPEGSLIWKTADDLYYTYTKTNKRTGEVTQVTKKRTQPSTKMAETDDAYSLISEADTQMERAYADYANKMKSLANQARKESMITGKIEYDSQAKATYQEEVKSLLNKLDTAKLNAPRERQANLKAYSEITKKKETIYQKLKEENPTASNKELQKMLKKEFDEKKEGQKALSKYRKNYGSVSRKERNIEITDREWEAIQAGAISETKLKDILNNTSIDSIRERATPKTAGNQLSAAKISRMKAYAQTYTIAEIAKKMNLSPSTVSKYLKGSE